MYFAGIRGVDSTSRFASSQISKQKRLEIAATRQLFARNGGPIVTVYNVWSQRAPGGSQKILQQVTTQHRSYLKQAPRKLPAKHPVLILALLTPAVLLIHGYHPLSDDGAIYVEGVKKLIYPDLYRTDAVFVMQHVRFSIFAHALAGVVRYTHLPLLLLLLLCHVASIFLFLLGCWKVAERVFDSPFSRWGAVLLAACCFTLPVAGTSLFIMDPYVTARSFSTPLSLFALAAGLGGFWIQATLWIVLAALFHPLMAGFAAIFLTAVALAEKPRLRALAVFAGLGLLASAVVFLATRHVSLDLASSQAALSRSYFFLSSWQWYEYFGLVLPLLLLLAAATHTRGKGLTGQLSIAALTVGSCAAVVALCFVHRSGSLLLARLQVLRAFHMIYLVGVLLLGGLLGRLAQRRPWTVAGLYLVAALAMFAGQRVTYPASNPVEWPGLSPRNPWQQAFLWARANTPKDAVFALDSRYIESDGEDAQSFRATAERSAIADWYKDGGIASMFPPAQELWWNEVQATEGLDRATDGERLARLAPFGVNWILLPATARTSLPCPYANRAVRVCRLGVR